MTKASDKDRQPAKAPTGSPSIQEEGAPPNPEQEYRLAAEHQANIDEKQWQVAMDFKRKMPPPGTALLDPGSEALKDLGPNDPGIYLGQEKADVCFIKNPEPKTSFGFVGTTVKVNPRCDRLKGQLVLCFDHKKLGTVNRESLRIFRWDKEFGFRKIPNSIVSLTDNYVFGNITHEGIYALIGVNAHPLILTTLHTFCRFRGLIGSVSTDLSQLLRDRICALILCASDVFEETALRPELLDHLYNGISSNYPIPRRSQRGWGTSGDLCQRCLGNPRVIPPECEILEEPPPPLCDEPNWETVGPRNLAGHIHRVVIDPSNSNRIYAAAYNGGVWVLDPVDRYPSVTWRPMTDDLDNLRISALKVATSDPDVLYAGMHNATVYRSPDAGRSWFRFGASMRLVSYIYELLIDHEDANTVYAATRDGFFRSSMAGDRWDRLYYGQIYDAVMDPDDASILYIGVENEGILKSYRSGETSSWEVILPWDRLPNPLRDGVDAVFLREIDGEIYEFFSGGNHIRFHQDQGVLAHFPKPINDHWSDWPATFTTGIDAAMLHVDNHRQYFFKGDQYIRYTPGTGVNSGYPRRLIEGWRRWPETFADGIDAAFFDASDEAYYFFKGDRFLRYTPRVGVDAGYPKNIADEWTGWPSEFNDIDAAVNHKDGTYYFFKGSQCLRFNAAKELWASFPKPIGDIWRDTYSPIFKIALGQHHPDGSRQSDTDRTVVVKFGNEVLLNQHGGRNIAEGWQQKGERGLDGYRSWCHVLAVDPFNSDVILAGQQQLFRTEDGGDRWDIVASYYQPHEDQHSIAFDLANRGVVYLANDGGVFRSTDNGRTWWAHHVEAEIRLRRNLNEGLVTAEFYRVGVQHNHAVGNLYHSGIIASPDLNRGRWHGIEGHSHEFSNIHADPKRLGRYYVFGGMLTITNYPRHDGIMRALFGEFRPLKGPAVAAIAVDTTPGSGLILAGTARDDAGEYHLMQTSQGDATPIYDEPTDTWNDLPEWEAVATTEDSPFYAMIFSPVRPNLAFAMTNSGRTFRNTDISGSGAWSEVGSWPESNVRQMTADNMEVNTLYAVSDRRVARSLDGGETWTVVGEDRLPNIEFHSLVADPSRTGVIYLGAQNGVYVSFDEGEHWSPYGDDRHPNAVVLQIFRQGNYLYSVTHGRGLWRTRIC